MEEKPILKHALRMKDEGGRMKEEVRTMRDDN
jgi:hypothetical protein